jgi:hypothetical protein
MRPIQESIGWQHLVVIGLLGFGAEPAAHAYIAMPPTTLGHMATWSDHAMLARVEKVDHDKKVITFHKVRDLKGKWPSDLVLHKIDPKPGDSKRAPPLDKEELRHIFAWAKEGKHAVLFAEKARAMAHTYVDQCWYSSVYTGDRSGAKAAWNTWYAIASAPDFLKSQCCGTPDELAQALTAMYAGKEAVVPVVREGTREDLRQGRAQIQGLRVGLRILTLDPKRDFVEWKVSEKKE